mgnify:CR=1 FL=1
MLQNGSVLTNGDAERLDQCGDNVFHGLENWVLDP